MVFGTRRIPKHLKINDAPTHNKKWNLLWISIAVVVLLGSMIISLKVSASETGSITPEETGINELNSLFYQNTTGHSHSDIDNKTDKTSPLPLLLPKNASIARVQQHTDPSLIYIY